MKDNLQDHDDYDPVEAERAKQEGMARAAAAYPFMDEVRVLARILIKAEGPITTDELSLCISENGYPPLGNAAGSVFKHHLFEQTGEYRKSARVVAHAHLLAVWRLKES